jgi:hypothetical protein
MGRVKVRAGKVVLSVYIQRNQAAPLSLTSARSPTSVISENSERRDVVWGVDWVPCDICEFRHTAKPAGGSVSSRRACQ